MEYQLPEPHLKLLHQLLIDVTDLFEKEGITYWIDGGTLLGSVRHKGQIPWDDDIDLAVLQKDFKYLRTALKAKVYWTLPNDYAPVQKALLEGKIVSPGCRLGESIERLVEKLTGSSSLPRRRWTSSFPSFFRKAG